MYQNLTKKDNVSLSLAHGYAEQENSEIFEEQYFISDVVNKNIWLGTQFLLKSKKWIAENAHKFDVVHCLTAFQHSFMFSLWFERQGVPVFIKIGQSDHTGFNENSLQSRILGLNRFRLKHANDITGYISISKTIREKLTEAGIDSKKIHSIPNGVDVDRFHPVEQTEKQGIRKSLGIEDKFTVIFTGAFSDRKNPLLISQAFQKFSNRDDIQLLLIGPDTDQGEQRRAIEEMIQETGSNNIYVKDFVKDIEEYYKASDLFVLPSNQEGFSNSMLEAQACGLPAVVTKISGSEDLIQESVNGTFVEMNSNSIFHAINSYSSNREKLEEESKMARNIIVQNYGSKIILQNYLGLFRTQVF
jgi:glycosyltransferase involved in cell wall biosynthesis